MAPSSSSSTIPGCRSTSGLDCFTFSLFSESFCSGESTSEHGAAAWPSCSTGFGAGLVVGGLALDFGSPDMFIWLVYLASEWATRSDGRFLAAAVAAWALGMYVDLALAPAIAVLPAIWLVYRPPVTLKPLLAAAAVLLIVWLPYLRFEAGRDFIDLRSQFLLQHICRRMSRGAGAIPPVS